MPCMLTLVLCALASCQGKTPAEVFKLDGQALATPTAVLSPLGWLEVVGRREGAGFVGLKLRFACLEWPTGSEQELSEGGVRAFFSTTPSQDGEALRGKLTVREFSPARVCFALRFEHGGGQHTAEVDLPATLYAPPLVPTVAGKFTPPDERPDIDDVVFCAFGNGGTGLPGQRQVAETVASLAPTGPLDFVVLLGNNFLPRGVSSERDPLFQTHFENVYDRTRLAVPFYVVQGPADHRGHFYAATNYSVMNPRWTSRATGFGVEFTCRGKTLELFGGDSILMAASIGDSRSRTSLRGLFDPMHASKADWKVVCAYDQLIPLGGQSDGPNMKVLESRARLNLETAKVDLLLSASGPGLRLVVPDAGIPQVLSGGGGGPEMAGAIEKVAGTKFAFEGGGFAWFRFDGTALHISFRDSTGKLLYAHKLTKP